MNKLVICNVQLFTLNQGIITIDEFGNQEVFNSSLNDLGKDIAGLCASKEISKISLIGPKDYLCNYIVPKIKSTYSANTELEIEINNV